MTRIRSLRVEDLRLPPPRPADGASAIHSDADHCVAYVVLETDQPGLEGHGLATTSKLDRGSCCAALRAMEHLVVGLDLEWIGEDMGRFSGHLFGHVSGHLTGADHLGAIGPDNGAIHLAKGAIVNAAADLLARAAGKPVWQLVADMSAEQIVRWVDFRHITDCITPREALALLNQQAPTQPARRAELLARGYACCGTATDGPGHDDSDFHRLLRQTIDAGCSHLKLKIGSDLQDDVRRLRIAREVLGPDRQLIIDANPMWSVHEAIEWLQHLAFATPCLVTAPTRPDDVEGHRRIRAAMQGRMQIAAGSLSQDLIVFKQMIVRGAIDAVRIDAGRSGGLHEVLAVMLMAARHGLEVFVHGAGPCEYAQHLSMIDYLRIAGSQEGRVIEHSDKLHEHVVAPGVVRGAACMPPKQPGFSAEMKAASIERYGQRGRASAVTVRAVAAGDPMRRSGLRPAQLQRAAPGGSAAVTCAGRSWSVTEGARSDRACAQGCFRSLCSVGSMARCQMA